MKSASFSIFDPEDLSLFGTLMGNNRENLQLLSYSGSFLAFCFMHEALSEVLHLKKKVLFSFCKAKMDWEEVGLGKNKSPK